MTRSPISALSVPSVVKLICFAYFAAFLYALCGEKPFLETQASPPFAQFIARYA
jgi:hypothetical protein